MSLRHTFLSLAVALLAVMAQAQPVPVTVDAGTVLRPVSPLLYGINTARWDESLFPDGSQSMLLTCDRDAIQKIEASGVTLLKYPGGNDADNYIWNSTENSPSDMDTDEYIALCRAVGAVPFITINFNAPPALATSWVRYCKEHGYNVQYWEVGDEQWGTWAKGHTSPEEYARKYIAFVRAMRAVDPSIKVATNVPLGYHPENWATRVLKAAKDYVDMLTVTYYPQQWGKENDDTLLASAALYRRLEEQLRRDVEQAVGKERASSILIVNVGYNSVNHSPGPQTLQLVNALWTADMLGSMAATGTDIACYWAVHNAFPPRKGDYAYLSSEGSNTPSLSYYVFPMFRQHFGDQLVKAVSGDSLVAVYAARKGKALTLMLINKHRDGARNATIDLHGWNAQSEARRWVLDELRRNSKQSPVAVAGNRFAVEVPAFSLTALELISADSVAPPENLARTATPSASSYSTIGPRFGPASAVDGITYTLWQSAAWTKSKGEEAQWFQLAWEAPVEIARVRILWGGTYATKYQIETSQDGVTWSVVKQVEGKGETEEFTWSPVSARLLRINGQHGSAGISAYGIREIEVYGSSDSGTARGQVPRGAGR